VTLVTSDVVTAVTTPTLTEQPIATETQDTMHETFPARVALVFLLTSACGGSQTAKPEPGSLGQQAADITADTQTLRAAQAAANEVVRNASDCPAVNQALPGANQAMDDAAAKVRTVAGRQSLDAMRKQVSTVAEACVGVQ